MKSMNSMQAGAKGRAADRRRWLGALIGSNLWLLLLGVDVAWQGDVRLGGVAFIAGALAAGCGWIAWRDRERIGMRNVMRGVLLCAGLAGLVAFVALDMAGHTLVTLGYLPASTPALLASGYPLLATFPVLAWFAR